MPVIYPGQTIGIIGNDQRAYKLALKAKEMGYRVAAIVTEQTQDSSLAAVLDIQIEGDPQQYETLARLGDCCQVLTYTDESLDETLLEQLVQDYNVPQGSDALSMTQDRYLEKVFLSDLNINISPYVTVVDKTDIEQGVDSIGYPCILKPIQRGFGRQYHQYLESPADLAKMDDTLELGAYLLESWVPKQQELAVMVAKDYEGQVVTLPIIENQMQDQDLQLSITPARIDQDVAEEIERLATVIGQNLDYMGIFGIEFFLTADMNIYVKRIVTAPHETGDVLNRILNFSQYEYHLKAICQLAIGSSRLNNAGVCLRTTPEQWPLIQTQMKIKPDWYFNRCQTIGAQESGYITAVGHNIQPLLDNFEAAELI